MDVKIFGILNLSPDSFSDGQVSAPDEAAAAAEKLIAAGADFVDLGAEATSPGTKPLDFAAELARLDPVVRALGGGVPLSIDTYKARIAAHCLERGARIINDVSALRADREMVAVLREHRAPVVLMYAKDSPLPHASDFPREYQNVVQEIRDFLARRVDFALDHGLNEKQLILDPGMGRFISPNPRYSWELLERFGELKALGFPLMACTSRKGFLGGEVSERDEASADTALTAIRAGAAYVRTHNPELTRARLAAWKSGG